MIVSDSKLHVAPAGAHAHKGYVQRPHDGCYSHQPHAMEHAQWLPNHSHRHARPEGKCSAAQLADINSQGTGRTTSTQHNLVKQGESK
eukprot:4549715-Amphidinium_carterae.1